MRPEVIRSVRRTELEASSEIRFQFQFARACHPLARVMSCLRFDHEERQRYRLPYSRRQHIKAIVMEGGRRKRLTRENGYGKSRNDGGRDRDRTCDPYHVKKAREVEAVEIQCLCTAICGICDTMFQMMFRSAGRTCPVLTIRTSRCGPSVACFSRYSTSRIPRSTSATSARAQHASFVRKRGPQRHG